uniref:L1 transposable element RRM domain-containing protein n=1 Tax=Latimeria chalumnae TaxID=7897 RepID=H3AUQ2_LATCH
MRVQEGMGKADKKQQSPERGIKRLKNNFESSASDTESIQDGRPSIAMVLREMKGMESSLKGFMKQLKEDVSFIKTNMLELQKEAQALDTCTNEIEQRVSDLEGNMAAVKTALKDEQLKGSRMREKLIDLEGQSRQNNLQLLGVREGTERKPWDMTDTVSELLEDIMPAGGDQIKIECAHRALSARPKPGQRPRVVIIKLLCFQDREKIIKLATEKGKIKWR